MGQRKMLAINQVRLELMDFCRELGLTLQERGEVGFMRPCVGFLSGSHYVEYSPTMGDTYVRIKDLDDEAVVPNYEDVPDAYHKSDCFAVLVTDGKYEVALRQLHAWMQLIQQRGGAKLVTFATQHTGMHLVIHGFSHDCLVTVPFWNKLKARIDSGGSIHPCIPLEQFKEVSNADSVQT